MEKVTITISVTKGMKFRARIVSRVEKSVMEVTVGSDSWNNGKGKDFHERIIKRCNGIVTKLSEGLDLLDGNSMTCMDCGTRHNGWCPTCRPHK